MKYKFEQFIDLFRYDLPRFIKNLYHFRRTLWGARPYDYHGIYLAMRDQLQVMEPIIRNGYHVHGERIADQIKTARLLLDRIIDHTEQYYFDDLDLEWKDCEEEGLVELIKINHTPRYSQAPRDSKLQAKIMREKQEQDFQLLMKLMTKYMRGWWE